MSVYCGNCKDHHPSADDVRACYQAPSSPMAQDSATDRQKRFINNLLGERDTAGLNRVVEEIRAVHKRYVAGEDISKAEAGKLINGLLGCDHKPKTPDPRWEGIPAGKYGVHGEDGHVFFVKVDKPEEGKWAGWTFLNILLGGPGEWNLQRTPRGNQRAILEKIAAAPDAAARLFGDKFKVCGRCGSPLSKVQSRAAGYGQTCANKIGWPYPGRAEAMAMLQERGIEMPSDEEVKQLELLQASDEAEEAMGDSPEWSI